METSREHQLTRSSGNRGALLLLIFAVAIILGSFFFWHDTWFGRRLSDQEITSFLEDTKNPRKIQHALSQIADRMGQGDSSTKQWTRKILGLVENPKPEIRMTVAWVMGENGSSDEFHQALLTLLNDTDFLVRRNAALGLVRFNDNAGRFELLKILKSYQVHSPTDGKIAIQLTEGQAVGAGDLLARVTKDGNQKIEVRAPLAGRIESISAQDGSTVAASTQILSIAPEPNQVWEALRGLYFIGEPEDIESIKRFEVGVPNMPERVRQQALATNQAIRTRAEHNSNPSQGDPEHQAR